MDVGAKMVRGLAGVDPPLAPSAAEADFEAIATADGVDKALARDAFEDRFFAEVKTQPVPIVIDGRLNIRVSKNGGRAPLRRVVTHEENIALHREQLRLAVLQAVGGPAVLGSYAYSFNRYPDLVTDMWGGVPEQIRGVYTAWMFVAAAGYLIFTYLFVFRTDPAVARVGSRRYTRLFTLYALVLFPSAAWMPMTGALLEGPAPHLWWPVKIGLWLTLIGSLGLLVATARTEPRWRGPGRPLAIAGALAFCFQTVVLDGIVWVWLFTPPA